MEEDRQKRRSLTTPVLTGLIVPTTVQEKGYRTSVHTWTDPSGASTHFSSTALHFFLVESSSPSPVSVLSVPPVLSVRDREVETSSSDFCVCLRVVCTPQNVTKTPLTTVPSMGNDWRGYTSNLTSTLVLSYVNTTPSPTTTTFIDITRNRGVYKQAYMSLGQGSRSPKRDVLSEFNTPTKKRT